MSTLEQASKTAKDILAPTKRHPVIMNQCDAWLAARQHCFTLPNAPPASWPIHGSAMWRLMLPGCTLRDRRPVAHAHNEESTRNDRIGSIVDNFPICSQMGQPSDHRIRTGGGRAIEDAAIHLSTSAVINDQGMAL